MEVEEVDIEQMKSLCSSSFQKCFVKSRIEPPVAGGRYGTKGNSFVL